MSTAGDIMSTPGVFITSGQYHEYIREYHEYIREYPEYTGGY